MKLLPGVFIAKKKDGTLYYRSSITFRSKHISIGSFPSNKQANHAYKEASDILSDFSITIEDYEKFRELFKGSNLEIGGIINDKPRN